ncbi:MAG: L,D-transpeptidase family protein [Phycisphaeraceae bacterium]
MTLSSQMSRSGMSRRNMASRRRRARRWPWVLVVAVLLAVGYWLFLTGEDSEGQTPATNDGETREVDTPGGGADDSSNASQTNDDRDTAPDRVRDMRPVVPTLTLGATATPDDAPAQPATSSRNNRPAGSRTTLPVNSDAVRDGMGLIADGKLVEGRRVLSGLLFDDGRRLAASDARAIRETLASVNEKLVFSPEVEPGDPLAEVYRVQSGDLLARIAPRYKLTYQFLERVNEIDARRLQVGQSIKLIRGPFHARVSKSEFRMDLYLRQPDGSPIYVRSYDVGLGEADSTPEGEWIIEPGRKVVNPDWRNPRTGDHYRADDPDNPIGDYWLAMKGVDANTEDQAGYGIHGTIDPDSVGKAISMGCIRLRDADIEQVFHLLVEGDSTVEVVR